ncbi:hypothetical protein [Spirosoma jeollabukense]
MKTDRFSDIIRRKLESIRPEFSEKDWAKMQSTLQQATMPQPGSSGTGQPVTGSIWSTHPWMMAAATVSTVALVTLGIWQRREINELRQTVGQLNKQQVQSTQKPAEQKLPGDARPDLTNASGLRPKDADASSTPSRQIDRQSVRPDTVYINRYVAVPSPSRSKPAVPDEAPLKQRIASPTQEHYAETSQKPALTDGVRQSTNQSSTAQTAPYDITSTSDKVLNNNPLETKDAPANQPENNRMITARNASGKKGENQATEQLNDKSQTVERLNEKNQDTERSSGANQVSDRITGKNRATKSTASNPINAVGTTNHEGAQDTPVQPASSVETGAVSANYELATSRPLSTNSLNWNALMAQRAKRMQPARTVPVTPAPVQVAEKTKVSAPESQPINQVAIHFRAGIGGEIASSLWSAGVFTETLIGKHLTVGVGLSQATYSGTFIDDFDFDVKTRRDFRKEYGLGRMIDPKRNILNIDTKTTRVQIPLSLGYRIPVTQTLSLLPTIGTSLNLKSAENITFYCPVYLPIHAYDQFQLSDNNRSAPLINTFALGVGLEWQRRHWVVQTSPLLTLPMQSESDPNWQNSTTLGLRARVLFQF